METPPMAVVETAAGIDNVLRSTQALPVRLAARREGLTEKAIYQRCNRGRQKWISVFGEVWVIPKMFPTGELGEKRK